MVPGTMGTAFWTAGGRNVATLELNDHVIYHETRKVSYPHVANRCQGPKHTTPPSARAERDQAHGAGGTE